MERAPQRKLRTGTESEIQNIIDQVAREAREKGEIYFTAGAVKRALVNSGIATTFTVDGVRGLGGYLDYHYNRESRGFETHVKNPQPLPNGITKFVDPEISAMGFAQSENSIMDKTRHPIGQKKGGISYKAPR